jgi:hypothetical protein
MLVLGPFLSNIKLERLQRKFEAFCYNRFFFSGNRNFLTLHIRHHHSDALFLINVLVTLNVAFLSSKQPASVFLLGTFATLPLSLSLPTAALQPDVFLLLIQLVNLQIFYKKCLNVNKLNH